MAKVKMVVDLGRPRVCPWCGSPEGVDDDMSPLGAGTGPGGGHRLGDPYRRFYRCRPCRVSWAVDFRPFMSDKGFTDTARSLAQAPRRAARRR